MAAFDPSRLYVSLLNTGLQTRDNSLYQVIHDLIRTLSLVNNQVNTSISTPSSVIATTVQQFIGVPGEDGIDGIDGIQGIQGPRGIQGIQGLSGDDGIEGEQGIQGLQGIRGIQGIQGIQGMDGDIIEDTFSHIRSSINIQDIISGFTTGSVLFAGLSGLIAQDNANLFWDDTNNRLGIGTAVPALSLDIGGGTYTFNGSTVTSHLGVTATTTNSRAFLQTVKTTGDPPRLFLSRARDSYTNIVDGDTLGDIYFLGYTFSNSFREAAQISAVINGTVSSTYNIPTDLLFYTNIGTGNTGNTEKLRITSAGRVGIGTAVPVSALDVRGSLAVSSINNVFGSSTLPTNWATRFTGSFTPDGSVGASATILVDTTINPPVGNDCYGSLRMSVTINKAASGTHAVFAGFAASAPAVGAGGATVTRSTAFYVNQAATGGVTNYNSIFDGGLVQNNGDEVITGALSIGTTTLLGAKNINCAGFIKTLGDVSKPSDQSITSSTTLTDDADLTAALNVAGTYGFEALIDISTGLSQGGIKIAMAYTGTTTSYNGTGVLFDVNTTNLPSGTMAHTQTIGAAIILYTSTAGGNGFCHLKGTIIVSNTGTLKVQWAQNASNVNPTTVRANSNMRVWRVL